MQDDNKYKFCNGVYVIWRVIT